MLKRIAIRLLTPPLALVLILIPIAAGMLIWAFADASAPASLVYLAYFLSAYTLTVACISTPKAVREIKRIKHENKYISRYFSDAELRTKISLYISLAFSTAYSFMQLGLGIANRSVWFYALALYYIILVAMRASLIKAMHRSKSCKNNLYELTRYRLCGILIAALNLALGAIVFYIALQNRGFRYHPIMTIAMAAYSFYSLTMAIINTVHYKLCESPLVSAATVIGLACATVSMLSLETAMFSAFGKEDEGALRQIMTLASGIVICLFILAVGIYMIIHATKEIRKTKESISNEQYE